MSNYSPRQTLRADALLLVVAVIWGSTFVAQRVATESLGPLAFNAARYVLGLLCIGALLIRRDGFASLFRVDVSFKAGAAMGVVLMLGSVLQQAGLAHTTAGKAGFITGLYVVAVPFFGLFLGLKPGKLTILGAAFAVAGLYLLSVKSGLALGYGESLVLVSALAWAAHVLMIGHFAQTLDPLRLAFHQFLAVAFFACAGMLLWEPTELAAFGRALVPLLYAGVLSTAIAFTLQIKAQKYSPPAHAALIMSTETIFAALSGWLVLDEILTTRDVLGCGLMLFGILLSQLYILRPRVVAS